MKELLVILLMVLVALYVGAVPDCIRVETTEPATFDVDWCDQPVIVNLTKPVGYCGNARCRSSHKTHAIRENVTRGMFYYIGNRQFSYCCYSQAYCRSAMSEERVDHGLLAKCHDGTTATIDVRYTNILSCECVRSVL